MAPPNLDDGPPMSINEMWTILTNREKNLVGRSLSSTRNFDIENFFPSAVRLVYDSNQSRDTVQAVELDTQDTRAPHATPDTTQHENITARETKLQVEPSGTEDTSGTALPRSDDVVDGDTKVPFKLALVAATASRTADDLDTPTCANGEAGSHKPMTAAALASGMKPHKSVQSSPSNGTDTANVFGSIFGSKTPSAHENVPCSISKNSGISSTTAPPKPLAEGDTVRCTFGCNNDPASTSPTDPTEVSQTKSGSLFGGTPISSSNTSEGTVPTGLFGSNPLKVVRPATTTSSLSTGLFGASPPTAQTNPAGSSAPTSIEAFGSGTSMGGFSFSESNKSPFGGGTSSTATGLCSGLSGPVKPAANGLFGTTRPSAGGSPFSWDSAAPCTSPLHRSPLLKAVTALLRVTRDKLEVARPQRRRDLAAEFPVQRSLQEVASLVQHSQVLVAASFGQGSAASSNSHPPTESASQGGFSFSKPFSGEEAADQSTESVQAGSFFGDSSSNVASGSHNTSLGSSTPVATTPFPAHDNAFNTNSGCSDGGPNVRVFGAQKRKNDEAEGYKEAAKKIRTTGSPLPRNGGSMFGGGFGFGWNTSEAKQSEMDAQVSTPTEKASTGALSSAEKTCQQTAGASSSSTHDSIPLKSSITTNSQTQVITTHDSLFSKGAVGKIEPLSNKNPSIRASSAKVVAGSLQTNNEENPQPTDQISSTGFGFGSVTTETKGTTATTTEDPFRNIRPTVLFDTVKPTVGLPVDPKDIPPDSTRDHFEPYRERETNGECIDFQSNHFIGELNKFSVEEARLADYNRGQRFGSFPNLLEMVPYEAPRGEPNRETSPGKSRIE